MIEFKLKTYKTKIDISDRICQKFKDPLIFYLAHKDDRWTFFITFVIADLAKKEMTYIFSYSPENLEKFENYEDKELFKSDHQSTPHCSLEINPGKDFYTFREDRTYFLYVNYQKNMMRAYQCKDLPQSPDRTIERIGSTFFKDEDDSNYFYLSAIENHMGRQQLLSFYKVSLDLSSFENIFRTPYEASMLAPHMTRKFKNYLLNSEFSHTQFKNELTGKIFENRYELKRYIYEDLYKEYCAEKNVPYSKKDLEAVLNNQASDPQFESYCKSKGKNILELAKNIPKYSFSPLPGTFFSVDIKNNVLNRYYTTFCAPAHFELDPKNDLVYTSSHNFVRFERTYYLGPAAIDKISIKDGKIAKVGVFSHPTGYRFTSHRVFYYQNRPYICTIGHPNRLFFIDAQSMELVYHKDLFEDVLSDKEDIGGFLNSHELIDLQHVAFEISDDGELIFIPGNKCVYFFSFPERKIVMTLPCLPPLEEGASLNSFYNRTIHMNYLN